MQLVDDKIIRVLGFQAQRLQRGGRKVFQIEGDDGIRMAHQCCREHMPIIGSGSSMVLAKRSKPVINESGMACAMRSAVRRN